MSLRGMQTRSRGSASPGIAGVLSRPVLALAAGVLVAAVDTPAWAIECARASGPTRTVVKVLDGETLLLDDAREVRLIGALPPHTPPGSASGSVWPLERATRTALSELMTGRTVALGYDGRRRDRYGRATAQVYLVRNGTRAWVQGALVARGLARAYGLQGNFRCLAKLIRLEAAARQAGIGIWRHAAYQVRSAARPSDLYRYRHTFQLVAGTVRAVATKRSVTYLNFGRDWRRDFTIVVTRGDRKRLRKAGVNLAALKGRRIRVRGWIEVRNGPMIRIRDRAELEILDGKAPGGKLGPASDDGRRAPRGPAGKGRSKPRLLPPVPGTLDL